jgi:hypothetical protein
MTQHTHRVVGQPGRSRWVGHAQGGARLRPNESAQKPQALQPGASRNRDRITIQRPPLRCRRVRGYVYRGVGGRYGGSCVAWLSTLRGGVRPPGWKRERGRQEPDQQPGKEGQKCVPGMQPPHCGMGCHAAAAATHTPTRARLVCEGGVGAGNRPARARCPADWAPRQQAGWGGSRVGARCALTDAMALAITTSSGDARGQAAAQQA